MGQLVIGIDGQIRDKAQIAIERLKAFEPPEGYYVAFSGGKDSQCVYHLCKMAGVKFDAHYNVTSVDPPELVRFTKDNYSDVKFERRYKDGRPITMWNLISRKGFPPTRLIRYCCQELKESEGHGRTVITGVRWAESVARQKNHGIIDVMAMGKNKKTEQELENLGIEYTKNPKGRIILNYDSAKERRITEFCIRTGKVLFNPIIDWTESDVWRFLDENNIKHCCLYDEGFDRLGCIGCPMAAPQRRAKEFERWPKYKELYLRAFGRMIEERGKTNIDETKKWRTPDEVMEWWMNNY